MEASLSPIVYFLHVVCTFDALLVFIPTTHHIFSYWKETRLDSVFSMQTEVVVDF